MGRKHGFNLPLDPHQVGSLVFFAFLVSGVYAFYVPCVEDKTVQITLLVVYTLLVFGTLCLNLATSLTDPSDPGVYDSTLSGSFYCALCQAGVGTNSKHCRACDRCVQGFDHHCKWLNNCIGEQNYRSFFFLVLSTVTLLLFQFGWGVWLVSRSFFASDEMELIVADAYGSMNYHGWQAALFIYLAFLMVAILMLGELFSFHLVLVSRGMTTYEFIMASKGTGRAMSNGSGGARAALFRSSRVADEASSRRTGGNVSLNPCKAMCAPRVEGDMQTWGQRNAAAGAAAPGGGGANGGVAGASVADVGQSQPQGEAAKPAGKSMELASYSSSMPISENYTGGRLQMQYNGQYNVHGQPSGYQQAYSSSPAHGYQQAQSLSPASGYQQAQSMSPAHVHSPYCAHSHPHGGYSSALGARSARLIQHAGPPSNGETSPAYIPPMMMASASTSTSQPRASPQGLQQPSPSMQTPRYASPPMGMRSVLSSPYSPYPGASSTPAAAGPGPNPYQSPTLPPQSPGRPGGFSTPPPPPPQQLRDGTSYDGSGQGRGSNQGLPSMHASSPQGSGFVSRNSGQAGARHLGSRVSGSPSGSVRGGSHDGQQQPLSSRSSFNPDAPRGSWRSSSGRLVLGHLHHPALPPSSPTTTSQSPRPLY